MVKLLLFFSGGQSSQHLGVGKEFFYNNYFSKCQQSRDHIEEENSFLNSSSINNSSELTISKTIESIKQVVLGVLGKILKAFLMMFFHSYIFVNHIN